MDFKRVVRQPRGPPVEVGEGQKNWIKSSETMNEPSSCSVDENFNKISNGQGRKSSISSAYGAESPNAEQNFTGFGDDVFGPSEELIYVTYAESPSLFWAQTADDETQEILRQLTEKLQIFCGNRPLLQTSPILRKIYGGIYSGDNHWYRCKILENIGDSKVKVHFVDFGNTEVIGQREVVCLSHELYSHPPYAKQYKLNDVNDPKDRKSELFIKGVEHLTSLVADKNVTAKKSGAYKSPTSACPVDLVFLQDDQVRNVNEEMIKSGFSSECQDVPEEKPSTQTVSKNPVTIPYQTTPLTSNVRMVRTSEYTPLRKPVTPNVQEGKVQELEETVKSQNKTIDTLKQMCRQLEQSRKLELEDKERKFKEQLGEANDQLNKAVSTKVTQLMNKVSNLRKLRKDLKDNGNSALSCIHDSINLLQEQKTIELNKMEELIKVKEVESLHESLQDKIKQCNEKDLLPGLVEERSKARQDLNEALTGFINFVQAMQLDLLKAKLQVAKTSLDLYIGNSSENAEQSEKNPPNMDVVKEYEEYMAKKEDNLKEMHTLVNQKCKVLSDVHHHIIRLLNLDEELDNAENQNIADLDDMMGVLEALIQEEVAKSKCSEAEAALRDKAVAALMIEVNKQLTSVQELRDILLEHYIGLQAKIQDSLRIKPDIDSALINKKTIRKLTSQLRHKQVDEVEMETEDATEEELQKLREELTCLYNDLHKAFSEEDIIINNLASLSKEHFPELLLQYPELGIGLCLATKGLVRSGRTVEQYPLEELESGVFFSHFCEKKCLIKEYFFRDASCKDFFQSQVVEFNDCTHKQLIDLQAVFYNKNGRIGYLQVPHYETLQEWLKTTPEQEEKKRVMKDILEALEALHNSDVIHGSISDNCIFVSHNDSGQTRGILGHYDFTEKLDSRVLHTTKKLGLSDDVIKCTPKFDLVCFGQLLASLIIPEWKSSSTTNDSSLLAEDTELSSLLDGLLSYQENSIVTAQEALAMTYFKESIVLQNGHISPVDQELD